MAAKLLGLPVVASEQYPQGLGPTVPELATRLEQRPAKLCFSCRELAALFADLRQRNIERLLVCGLETHVCIQQTVLDLMADGWRVYVAVDAVGSRYDSITRPLCGGWKRPGAVLTTTEAALFEWCQLPARRNSSRSAASYGKRHRQGSRIGGEMTSVHLRGWHA